MTTFKAVYPDIKGYEYHNSMAKVGQTFGFRSSSKYLHDQTNAPSNFATKEFPGNAPRPLGLLEGQ